MLTRKFVAILCPSVPFFRFKDEGNKTGRFSILGHRGCTFAERCKWAAAASIDRNLSDEVILRSVCSKFIRSSGPFAA